MRRPTAPVVNPEEETTTNKGVAFKARSEKKKTEEESALDEDLSKEEMREELNPMDRRFDKVNSKFEKYNRFCTYFVFLSSIEQLNFLNI